MLEILNEYQIQFIDDLLCVSLNSMLQLYTNTIRVTSQWHTHFNVQRLNEALYLPAVQNSI
jgi:hypothetical protein